MGRSRMARLLRVTECFPFLPLSLFPARAMPFLDFPARGLNLYYTINPKGPAPTSIKLPPPETGPIDPQKPILVMLHSTATSTACFAAQVRV